MDPTLLLDDVSKLGGRVGLLATVLFFLVRAYRIPFFQGALPVKLQWKNLAPGVQWAALAALAVLGAGLDAYANGGTPTEAFKVGFGALLAAVTSDNAITSLPVRAAAQVVFQLHPPPALPAEPATVPQAVASITEKVPSLPPAEPPAP